MCDKIADTCGGMTRGDCDTSFQSLFCKSDAVMQSCMDAMSAAECTDPLPDACNNVANTEPAVRYCYRFIDLYCKRMAACDLTTYAECEGGVGLPCDQAVGVSPSGPACAEALPGLSCGDVEGGNLPSSCIGSVKFTQ